MVKKNNLFLGVFLLSIFLLSLSFNIGVNSTEYWKNGDSSYDFRNQIFTSNGTETAKEAPAQWGDFIFSPYGNGDTTGDLLSDDGNFSVVNSGYYYSWGSESYKDYLVPNADIQTYWNEADSAPHYSKLDEATGDLNGDGGNIREHTIGVDDEWHFTTLNLSANEYVTQMQVYMYVKGHYSDQTTYFDVDTNAAGVSGYIEPLSTSYVWKSFTDSGLQLDQDDLDGFTINIQPADIPHQIPDYKPGWLDIETVYVKIYTKIRYTNNLHDWTVTWDVPDVNLTSIDSVLWEYCTTINVSSYVKAWNYTSTSWLTIESGSGTSWINGSYDLTNDLINESDQVKLRFQTTSTTSSAFDIQLDQLYLNYTRSS